MQAEGVDPSSSVQWREGLAPLYFMLAFKWGRIHQVRASIFLHTIFGLCTALLVLAKGMVIAGWGQWREAFCDAQHR
jgi:hypothetical protein